MRLNFSTKMPFDKKIETHFEDKILNGTKIHTLRNDPNGRWRAGRAIQFTNGERFKPNTFKIGECISVQDVNLTFEPKHEGGIFGTLSICVDGTFLSKKDMGVFIKNDGFEQPTDFLWWFFPQGFGSVELKLINWTDKNIKFPKNIFKRKTLIINALRFFCENK